MPDQSSTELSLKNRRNAHISWAKTADRSARTAPARKALEERFLREAGGDPKVAESLRKAYFQNLVLKSVEARRRRREAQQEARRQRIAAIIAGDAS